MGEKPEDSGEVLDLCDTLGSLCHSQQVPPITLITPSLTQSPLGPRLSLYILLSNSFKLDIDGVYLNLVYAKK